MLRKIKKYNPNEYSFKLPEDVCTELVPGDKKGSTKMINRIGNKASLNWDSVASLRNTMAPHPPIDETT